MEGPSKVVNQESGVSSEDLTINANDDTTSSSTPPPTTNTAGQGHLQDGGTVPMEMTTPMKSSDTLVNPGDAHQGVSLVESAVQVSTTSTAMEGTNSNSSTNNTTTNTTNNNNTNNNEEEEEEEDCFFADATLDLEEAHGIVETPDGKAKIISNFRQVSSSHSDNPTPTTTNTTTTTTNTTTTNNNNNSTCAELIQQYSIPDIGSNEEQQQVPYTTSIKSSESIASANSSLTAKSQFSSDNEPNNTHPTTTTTTTTTTSTTKLHLQQIQGNTTTTNNNQNNNANNLPTSKLYRPKSPRYPRDVSWIFAALLVIPFCLFSPYSLPPPVTDNDMTNETDDEMNNGGDGPMSSWMVIATAGSSKRRITMSCLFTLATCIGFYARFMYLSRGGGDGEDQRHSVSHFIVAMNTLSTFLIFPILCLKLYWLDETDDVDDDATNDDTTTNSNSSSSNNNFQTFIFWILLLSTIREIYIFSFKIFVRHSTTSTTTTTTTNTLPSNTSAAALNNGRLAGAKLFGCSNTEIQDGKRTFFRELVCTSLDILSRSLRCQSFYRLICILLLLQCWIVLQFVTSFRVTLRRDGGFISFMLVFVGAKWSTDIIVRLLGFVASGGVSIWFAQQSLLIEQMEMMKEQQQHQQQQQMSATSTTGSTGLSSTSSSGGGGGGKSINGSKDEDDGYHDGRIDSMRLGWLGDTNMPEAYRTVDANTYSSVIDFDEGMDDDYEDDGGDLTDSYSNSMNHRRNAAAAGGGGGSDGIGKLGGVGVTGSSSSSSRVKMNSKMPNVEWTGGGSGSGSTVKSFIFSALTTSLGSIVQVSLLGGIAQIIWYGLRSMDAIMSRFSGFRSMTIGVGGSSSSNAGGRWENVKALWRRIDLNSREFVRNHSDLGLSHVAAYFKSAKRASNDVISLIESSGVEPIIHDDISRYMCASVSKGTAGMIVFILAQVLYNHPDKSGSISDTVICEIMTISFFVCYTMISTVMEPLRASIKALYVCFAEHPQSLKNAFPLVYFRLSRLSEENVMV